MRAMVLTAGYGTRLGTLTRDTPKPMLRVKSIPLLEHIIRHLVGQGFTEIAVNLHFRPEMIADYFGTGAQFGVKLTYSYEEKLLGTAGGVKKMADFLRAGEAFLVQYGDVVTNQDFAPMIEFHRERTPLATLLLHRRRISNSVIQIDENGCIVAFLERPDEQTRRTLNSDWVNSGIYLCSPKLLDEIPPEKVCDFPRDIFRKLVENRQLCGFPLSGYRCAVDSPQRLQELESILFLKCGTLNHGSARAS